MSMPKGTVRKTHCKRGHERTPENVHKNGTCKLCQKERLAQYNKDHPEKQKTIQKRWRDNNPSKVKEKMARWRAANIEKAKEQGRAYRLANPEKTALKNKKYRTESPGKLKAACQRWKKNNPKKLSDLNRHRRARIAGATVEVFASQEIYERDKWRCGICGEWVNSQLVFPTPRSASLDHIIPITKGGGHSRANTQLAHLVCNMRKGDRTA